MQCKYISFLFAALLALQLGAQQREDNEFDINKLPEPLRSWVIDYIEGSPNKIRSIRDLPQPLQRWVKEYVASADEEESSKEDTEQATKTKHGWSRIIGTIPQELKDLERYMKDNEYRQRYLQMGTHPVKGVLMAGPPGVGKTTLARALSEVVSCEFISASATDFVSPMPGASAAKINKLFADARKKAKQNDSKFCLIYLDEFEVFADRESGMPFSHSGDAVRALLAAMDGFDDNTNVIVLAATNFVSGIDKALIRPGRFDTIVNIDLPDEPSRKAILEYYAQKGTYDASVSWERVAKCTNSFAPADLEEVVAKAGRLAANEEAATCVTAAHVLTALYDSIKQNGNRGLNDVQVRLAHVDAFIKGETGKFGFSAIAGKIHEDIQKLYDQIKNPKKYEELGIQRPKGILFTGPPGVGKTAMARALAEELGCEFISAKGSQFVNKFVGTGAANIRKLFSTAERRAAGDKPVILFIDELDAIGGKRDSKAIHTDVETQRTIDELLTQMDGFLINDQVMVIGATNIAETLDDALLRPGRFDKTVEFDLPEIDNRIAIVKKYLKGVKISKKVETQELGRLTFGCSPAEIKQFVKLAKETALDDNERTVLEPNDFREALERLAKGLRVDLKDMEATRRKTAYHEMGHALIGLFNLNSYPVYMATIVPRRIKSGSKNLTLGHARFVPKEDVHSVSKEEYEARIMAYMGGRAAEEIIIGKISSGAWNDIQEATRIAREMVCIYGMSDELGLVQYSPAAKGYSQKTLELIDDEVRRITNEMYAKAKKILEDNIDLLHKLATQLLEKETIYYDEMYKIAGLEVPTYEFK